MLRQIFRQRGAYNVVNLPITASQDEPGTRPGRADNSSDWRRHYNPALEPEFREDVGLEAWARADWYTDSRLSSTAAAKILRKRLEMFGPQRERNLQEVIARIRSGKDAEMALKAAELFRRYRSSREQHTPFKISTSKMIIQRALEVNAGEVAVEALERKDELGFNFISLKAYREAITHFSSKGDLKNVLRVFELAKEQGLKPNRDLAFCILRACLDCGQAKMAYAYAKEFQKNGIRISPAQRIKIEAESGKMLPPIVGEESGPYSTSSRLDRVPAAVQPTTDPSTNVTEEADRIIAAAFRGGSASAELEASGSPAASVSTTGEAETVVGEGVTASPAVVVSSAEVELTSQAKDAGTGGKGVVAATSVQPDPDKTTGSQQADGKENPPKTKQQEAKFEAMDAPGIKEAIEAELQSGAQPVQTGKELPLRRAKSI